MGHYRFSVYVKWQLSIGIKYDYGQIIISIVFLNIHISLSKYAKGNNILKFK